LVQSNSLVELEKCFGWGQLLQPLQKHEGINEVKKGICFCQLRLAEEQKVYPVWLLSDLAAAPLSLCECVCVMTIKLRIAQCQRFSQGFI
jgi:hypothetical protein